MKLVEISKDSWVIKENDNSLGLLTKFNGVYSLLMNGTRKRYKGNTLPTGLFSDVSKESIEHGRLGFINGYPVNYQDYLCTDDDSGYPTFKKAVYSDILYCAGYYCVNFNNTWIPLFCPKLKTILKYTHLGPCVSMDELSKEISRQKNHKIWIK
jgi:hypothetical protein